MRLEWVRHSCTGDSASSQLEEPENHEKELFALCPVSEDIGVLMLHPNKTNSIYKSFIDGDEDGVLWLFNFDKSCT